MRYTGIDTKRVVRKGAIETHEERKDFNALLGVGVSVNDLDLFGEQYKKIMEDIFAEIGIKPRRPVFKAKDLNQIFYPTGVNPLEKFLQGIADHIVALDVYYAYFLKKDDGQQLIQTPYIEIYYADPIKRQKITAIEFLNLIDESYPAYCAWEQIRQMDKTDSEVFVDNFKIRHCKTWNEIHCSKALHITPWGDRCNYLISTADILASAIDERLRAKKITFKYTDTVLPEFESKLVLNPSKNSTYMLAPAKDEFALTDGRLTRPITYIFKFDPEIFSKLYSNTTQKDMIIDSAVGDKLISEATKNLSSLKFFETSDIQKIQAEDTFIYFDEYGRKQISVLQSLGFKKNKIIDGSNV